MKGKVFTTEATAQAFADSVDAALGFPREESPATAQRMGGGRHVPWERVRTETHGEVIKHPTLAQWAYTTDDVVRAINGLDTSDEVDLPGVVWRPTSLSQLTE